MDDEERGVYKKFLPENRMADLTGFQYSVLEEITFMNDNEFKPAVASLADPLQTDADTVEDAVNALKMLGLVQGRERFEVTPMGAARVASGQGAIE